MSDRVPTPHDALASIQNARRDVVKDVKSSPGYELAYGAACGLLVASQGMPQPWSILSVAIGIAALALMVQWWRKANGWWVNGYSPRRARWVAIGTAALLIAAMGVSLYGRAFGPWWLFIPAGVGGAVIAAAGSRLWMRVWRREVEEAPGGRT